MSSSRRRMPSIVSAATLSAALFRKGSRTSSIACAWSAISGCLTTRAAPFRVCASRSICDTNSPLAPDRIKRRQVYFPIPEAVPVEAGDRVDVGMTLLPEDGFITWQVTVARAAGDSRTFRQSLLLGMLLDPADLARTRPDYRPALTPRGVARLTVLTLCDGRRSLREIEAEVYERHRDLFAASDEAAEFVTEVVSRYSTDG